MLILSASVCFYNKMHSLSANTDAPFAPRELKVVEYNLDYVTLSWTAPEHDGGSPILGYVVEKRDSMMNMWSQAAKVDKDTFTVKVTNLFEGQNYLFRVAAENQSGRGAYAELPKPVTARLPFGMQMHLCLWGSLGVRIIGGPQGI